MRIYDRDLTGTASAESGRSQETQRTDRDAGSLSSPTANSSGDRIELSSGLAIVSKALAGSGTDRAQKMQLLAAQIQAGSYNPDSLAISQGMVAQALSGGLI